MRRTIWKICVVMVAWVAPALSQTPVLHAPSTVTAGSSMGIGTTGRGTATFYLVGPSHALKRTITLGQDITISGQDIAASGLYQAVACGSDGCANAGFQVLPSAPARLNFVLHPSRVPVSTPNAVNGTALVSDRFHNTVIAPAKVDFRIVAIRGILARSQRTSCPRSGVVRNGVASETGCSSGRGLHRRHHRTSCHPAGGFRSLWLANERSFSGPRRDFYKRIRFEIVPATHFPTEPSYRLRRPMPPAEAPWTLRSRRTRRPHGLNFPAPLTSP